MKIYNGLPLLLKCLEKWETIPSRKEFNSEYAEPMSHAAGDFFDEYYSTLQELDWPKYRDIALQLDPQKEERRVLRCLEQVQNLFGFKLEGEVVLHGAFEGFDGFARFDRGTHRVHLGVDESHLKGRYLDILITHEFTHVARESRPEVWTGFGLDPKMTRDDFVEKQPVIEHLMGEGFSCAISEILNPGEAPLAYTFQEKPDYDSIIENFDRLSQKIHAQILSRDQDYWRLYRLEPSLSHYVWAFHWVKSLLKEHDGDPRKLVSVCSKEFLTDALEFNRSRMS